MIKIAMYTTIITLYKKAISQRQIAKLTKTDRKTVSKIIKRYKEEGLDEPVIYQRESILNLWHGEIVSLLEKSLSCQRIHEELRHQGCQASYSALTRYVKKHKIKDNSCIRFHTRPGEEAQVDFGDIGLQYTSEGKRVKAYVFNMRLSYSRFDYYEVVFDQTIKTWIECHINAFNYFAGVPEVIKLDNLKAGVIDANFYEPVYQKEYKRLAEHYGILLSPCRVYQPQEKGKVESGIKYVKNNFFAGRSFNSYTELEVALERWQENANMRVHGTTKKIPVELFAKEEKNCLKELPIEIFDLSTWHNRKVAKDCHITIENNYYSVPAKYITCDVLVQLSPKLVEIFSANNESLARHNRVLNEKGVFTTNPSHYGKYKKLCPGFIEYDEYCKKQMQDMGINCKLFLEFLRQEREKDWHRTAKGIISLRKNYSDDLIDKACQRGLYYGIVTYSKIKNILQNNAVNLPLPECGGEYARIN
jgi:transposase